MTALIPLLRRAHQPAVSARALYRFLELEPTNYARWTRANIVRNAFATEGEDWGRLVPQEEYSGRGQTATDYALRLPFAKKLAMASKSAKGEQVRDYFLACERRAGAAVKPGKWLPHQTPAWREVRAQGKGKRKQFAGVLAAHGVRGEGFSHCTNAIYVPLFGSTAREQRVLAGFKPSACLRDHLTGTALHAVALVEAVAADRIERHAVQSSYRCQEIIERIATRITAAIGGPLLPVARQLA